MIRPKPQVMEARATLADTGIPRNLLKHVISSGGLTIGSRVLDVGCGSGELVAFLSELGFEAAGLDNSPQSIATGRRAHPQLDLRCSSVANSSPFEPWQFDLVLIRDLTTTGGSLLDSHSLRATADLMALTRPGGSLVFMHPLCQPGAAHDLNCIRRHASQFPGNVQVGFLRGRLATVLERWRQMAGGSERTSFATVTLTIPREPMSREECLEAAERRNTVSIEPCCLYAAASTTMTHRHRKAA